MTAQRWGKCRGLFMFTHFASDITCYNLQIRRKIDNYKTSVCVRHRRFVQCAHTHIHPTMHVDGALTFNAQRE